MSIDSIQARVEKATEGPWLTDDTHSYREPARIYHSITMDSGEVVFDVDAVCTMQTSSSPNWRNDRDFAAHARADIPALLEVARIAKGLNECPPSPHNGWWQVLAVALDKLEAME
jgi:hypothetical protein